MSIWTAEDKKRIANIATIMVADLAKNGQLDLDDKVAVEAALRKAVRDATSIYAAALEYVSG